jgi:hypothetical protein
MQEKKQNKSPLKQRILHFVTALGISKREFYSITGISRGTLENDTGITEDTLTKFIATYPDVNIKWLILGIGEMRNPEINYESNIEPKLATEEASIYQKSGGKITEEMFIAYLEKKDKLISELSEEIGHLKERLNQK